MSSQTTRKRWRLRRDASEIKTRKEVLHFSMSKIPDDETGPYNSKAVYMHRIIMNAQPGDLVLHLNGNRRENLKLIKLADRKDLKK